MSFAFGRFLYKKGRLDFLSMLHIVCSYFLQKIGLLSLYKLHRVAFKAIFFKKQKSEIEAQVQEFLASYKECLFRDELIENVKAAQARGELLWIQSSSPDCLVIPIATHFTISHVTASTYCVDATGAYSHVGTIVDGEMKKEKLLAYTSSHAIALKEVIAYSDSILDLPLLAAVGTPICVCPDKKLYKHAVKHSWSILHL